MEEQKCMVCGSAADWEIRPEPAKGKYTLLPDYYCKACTPRWVYAMLRNASPIVKKIRRKEAVEV